jgi:hypothetical protein
MTMQTAGQNLAVRTLMLTVSKQRVVSIWLSFTGCDFHCNPGCTHCELCIVQLQVKQREVKQREARQPM